MILSAISLGIGITKGILSVANRWSERQDKIDSLNDQTKQLKTERNNLTTNYNAEKAAGEKVIANTLNNRDTSLNQSASSRVQQDALAQQQMATIAVQASEAEGQAVNQAAQSGFRNTGSNTNGSENAKQSGEEAMAQAKAQVSLSRFQDYSSAKNSYTSATQQIDSYKDSMSQAATLYQQKLAAYNTNIGKINNEVNDMNSFWGITGTVVGSALDLAGGIMSGASGAVNMKSTSWGEVWGAVTA
jgi:hypothetical protein